MTLADWIAKQTPRHGALKRLATAARVSYATIRAAAKGAPVRTWERAARISKATGGKVSALELCEPKRRNRS